MSLTLEIIIASTRPGRIGDKIGAWFAEHSRKHSEFEVVIADLAEINLPIFDEPQHPRLGNYVHAHTKAWSARVDAADAFVMVTPEYNYSMPPSLVNAVDFLHREWAYKPVGFVGYGGVGAARAIQMEKQLVTAVGMMPIPASVNLVGVHAAQPFTPEPKHEAAANTLLTELMKWAIALRPMRVKTS